MIYGSLIILVIVIAVLILGWSVERSANKKAARLVRNLDDKYSTYIVKVETFFLLEDREKRELNQLMDDIMRVLKPEIESLIAFAGSCDPFVPNFYEASTHFVNAAAELERFIKRRRDKIYTELSEDDLARLDRAIRDAISTDLEMRELDLKIGKI